uniref:Uncharacterized protein n=1 Tax=Trichobilharzia regenti TaxID=157069 RepID=A0AA85K9I1_TRIRE|nr:unnamed protein product [Trichobilharzia regenti]
MELHSTTVHKFYSYINDTYALPTRKLINKLTRLSQTEARFTNHRIFNSRCLKNHLIPKYLRLRSTITSSKITSTAEHVSRLCLKEELHRITVKLNNIRNQIEKLKHKLKYVVNDKDYIIVVETSRKARESAFRNSKITQIKKLNKLNEEKNTTNEIDVNASFNRTKWVTNLSSRGN